MKFGKIHQKKKHSIHLIPSQNNNQTKFYNISNLIHFIL